MSNDITLSHVFTLSPENLREFAKAVQFKCGYKGIALAAYCQEIAAYSYNRDFKLEFSYTMQLPDTDDSTVAFNKTFEKLNSP
jgi:hypothetical protein